MGNLNFPQLSSGALAQFPIRKQTSIRTIANSLLDGSVQMSPDPAGKRLIWQLTYVELSLEDVAALQQHFTACSGALRGFSFIDPTANILAASSDLSAAPWLADPGLSFQPAFADPMGGQGAVLIVNSGQTSQTLSQQTAIPAGFRYCFSVYVQAAQSTSISLIRQGATDAAIQTVAVTPNWNRVFTAGSLNDDGLQFTASISIPPAQSVILYGPQLEAQLAPSAYRATATQGGVYTNAHWAVDDLVVTADGPNSYSTTFRIDTNLQS